MNKLVLTCLLSAAALTTLAQSTNTTDVILDPKEDPEQVVTIADIVAQQQRVTSQNSVSSHFEKVWGNKTFFNMSYMTSASLNPKEKYDLGFDLGGNIGDKVPEFKADYGVALQIGHSYNLHKKPIANTVYINLDYTYFDLSMAHYEKEKGEKLYNSNNTWSETVKNRNYNRQYIPWALSKYEVNYGMNLGPSLTIAPFTYVNVPQLHFLKFNVYYHIGYQAGILWMPNNKDADVADTPTSSYMEDNDPLKINWQHGLMQSFGFNMSWKSIGVGFETRTDNRSYKSVNTSTYGSKIYKFDGKSARIYLRICY